MWILQAAVSVYNQINMIPQANCTDSTSCCECEIYIPILTFTWPSDS